MHLAPQAMLRTLALHRCQLSQKDMQLVLAIIEEGLLRSLQVRRPPPSLL